MGTVLLDCPVIVNVKKEYEHPGFLTFFLQLEKNIRLIALAAGWTKHVDDWSPQVSAAHTGTSVAVTTAKRGGNGKRLQKNSTLIAMTAPIDARVFRNFYWCKGGRLSTQVLQLPYAIAKRAGRQGVCFSVH